MKNTQTRNRQTTMARHKSERKPKNIGEAVGFRNILSSEKTDFLLGLVLLIVSILLITAMFSFLKTGQADQSILEDLRPGEWMNQNRSFKNNCGSLGAIVSYTLITVNFGLPAFLIPFFFIVVGLKLMKTCTPNLWKWFFCLTVIMIWSSVAFAKVLTPWMPDLVYNPGGRHGMFCVQQLENIMGAPGLTAVLIFSAIAFLTYLSSETIPFIRRTLNPIGYMTSRIKLTVTDAAEACKKNVYDTENVKESKPNKTVTKESPSDKEEDSNTNVEPEPITIVQPQTEEAVTNSDNKENSQKSQDEEDKIAIEIPEVETKAKGGVMANPDADLSTPINPQEPFTKYKYPTLNLLHKYDNGKSASVDMEEIKANNQQIVKALKSFGVNIEEIRATIGPTITLYEITPAAGVRISRIRTLEDDIALSLAALGIRIIAPIPGKGTIGIEVPNKKPNIVSMESILNTKKFQETKFDLPIAIGKTITNDVFIADLAKIPHLLVAGATGQGKSVGLNAIITSLLYKKHPNELKLVLIDPKKVEFSIYAPIAKHFMASLPENDEEPIITDVTKVIRTLKSLCTLMDYRYDMLKLARARNIKEYNEKFVNHKLRLTDGHEFMPYIVVVIDEFGDLIMTAGKEIETPIARIAQLARAVGIHMVIATQRPTTSIITGNIKANFPGRMAFKVTSVIDSRTILDRSGAQQLIGRGDMLILDGKDPDPKRLQCAFVDTPEVEKISAYIAMQPGPIEPMELPEPKDADESSNDKDTTVLLHRLDPLFEEAARFIVNTQQGSTSNLQRHFSIGYNRAGRLMDQLEKAGIVGVARGSKPREVIFSDENQVLTLINQLKSDKKL